MSSTNRGAERQKEDFYETPVEAIESILRVLTPRLRLLNHCWIEPCAGHGRIIRTVDSFAETNWSILPRPRWTAIELREEALAPLGVLCSDEQYKLHCPQDFLTLDFPITHCKYGVAMTNPPFKLAMPIIEKSLQIASVTIMLLRLNFLGSSVRADFHQQNPADVYVLKKRPNFLKGQKYWDEKDQCFKSYGGDSIEYAWFVWGLSKGGHWQVID